MLSDAWQALESTERVCTKLGSDSPVGLTTRLPQLRRGLTASDNEHLVVAMEAVERALAEVGDE